MTKLSVPRLKQSQLELIPASEQELRASQATFSSRIKRIWASLLRNLMSSPDLHLWSTCDRAGNVWWSGFDATTERSIHQVSEEQMRIWIEQRYYRRVDSNANALKSAELSFYRRTF